MLEICDYTGVTLIWRFLKMIFALFYFRYNYYIQCVFSCSVYHQNYTAYGFGIRTLK